MKHLRKVMALVLAALVALFAVTPAWAEDGTPAGAVTKDGTISVSGLESGDTVEFYRVLKFDQNAAATGGWAADTGFTSLTTAQIQKMLGLDENGKPVTITTENAGQYGISAELAGTIGDLAENATAKYTDSTEPPVIISDGTATVTGPADGLYVAIIHPGKAGIVYNPVFVGADYKTNSSNTWAVDMNDSYSPASMAKKSEVKLEKEAKTEEDDYEDGKPETVAVGDTVNFTVDATIPEFSSSYTSAVYKVSDELTQGLEYQKDAKVYVVTKTTATNDETGDEEETEVETEVAASDATYTIDNSLTSGYTINFASSWLLAQESATQIRIKYTAKVTTDAPENVNIEKNTVTVNYSNNPTDTVGKGILKDATKHYTFDIDADILGEREWILTEAVKVGLDKDGNEITETVVIEEGREYGALEGATFKLYVADSESETKIKNDKGVEINASLYTNDIIDEDTVIVSDEYGRLNIQGEELAGIRGLDAGTYYLVEESAPEGYIKAQNAAKIVIEATIVDTPVTEYYDETADAYYDEQNADGTRIEVKYSVPTLTEYKVFINDVRTATYTFENDAIAEDSDNDDVVGYDGLIGAEDAGENAAAGKIQNPQGTELPSTGGMGTRILYAVGGIMIAAGGIFLVSKRRLSSME